MTSERTPAHRLAPLQPYRLPLTVLLISAVLALAWTVQGRWAAAAKLADLDLRAGEPLDVEVELDFEPERFHLERFQAVGRYLGWQDGRATVLDADPDALHALARAYWVADIHPVENPS